MPKKQECENQAENTLNAKSRTLICFMIIDPRHGIKFSYFGGNLLTGSQIAIFDKIDGRSKCE
jgi:hypothetical protein